MKKPDAFYLRTYKLLKILPKILVVLTALLFIYLAIENEELSVVFMGVIATLIVYLLTTILIAPVILQTDALVEIQTYMADGKNIEAPLAPPTPQPISENEYFCEKMEEIGMFRSGKCSSCLKEYAKLELCKIKYSDDLTQKYLCPSCKDKFRKNSK